MRKPARPPGIRPLAQLALIFAAHVVAFVVVYVVSVRTVTGRELADASLRGAISARPLLRGTVQTILDVVSVASLLGAVAVVAVIALVRLARLEGLAAIGILVGSNVSTWLLKNVLLTRPDLGLDEIAPATLNSLPSGHTTAAFSAAAALVFVTPRRWRAPAATLGAVYAALTGLASMLAGWHRTSDAVAAFLVVGAWTTVAAAAVVVASPSAQSPTSSPPAVNPLLVRRLGLVASGVLVLGVVVTLGLVVASLASDSLLGSVSAFFAGSLFITGSAAVVTVADLKVLDVMEAAVGDGGTEPQA